MCGLGTNCRAILSGCCDRIDGRIEDVGTTCLRWRCRAAQCARIDRMTSRYGPGGHDMMHSEHKVSVQVTLRVVRIVLDALKPVMTRSLSPARTSCWTGSPDLTSVSGDFERYHNQQSALDHQQPAEPKVRTDSTRVSIAPEQHLRPSTRAGDEVRHQKELHNTLIRRSGVLQRSWRRRPAVLKSQSSHSRSR